MATKSHLNNNGQQCLPTSSDDFTVVEKNLNLNKTEYSGQFATKLKSCATVDQKGNQGKVKVVVFFKELKLYINCRGL